MVSELTQGRTFLAVLGRTTTLSERTLGALLASLLLLFAMVNPVGATHSVPSPRWFYDDDNDAIAEATDADPRFQKLGTGWTAAQTSRYQEALAYWQSATDFNPVYATSAVNGLYMDGRDPAQCGYTWADIPTAIGINCKNFSVKATYVDISQSWIYMNNDAFVFSAAYGAPQVGEYDLRGLMEHELGHSIRLVDLSGSNCPPGPSMCGSITPSNAAAQTYALRSLTSDDINAANLVYLP